MKWTVWCFHSRHQRRVIFLLFERTHAGTTPNDEAVVYKKIQHTTNLFATRMGTCVIHEADCFPPETDGTEPARVKFRCSN